MIFVVYYHCSRCVEKQIHLVSGVTCRVKREKCLIFFLDSGSFLDGRQIFFSLYWSLVNLGKAVSRLEAVKNVLCFAVSHCLYYPCCIVAKFFMKSKRPFLGSSEDTSSWDMADLLSDWLRAVNPLLSV